MSSEPTKKTRQQPGMIARAWERRVERNRSRRRVLEDAEPRRPGATRLFASLHDVWRWLWGTHESSAK